MNLFEVAREIANRLERIFLRDESGRRPVYGGTEKFQNDPHWRDYILFYEYFHKRLATSFLIASRSNGFSESDSRKTVLRCVRSYRERMAGFAQMRTMEVWYARLDLETILPSIKDQEAQKRLQRRVQKTETSDVLETDFPKLVSFGKRRADDPGQSSPDLSFARASRPGVRGHGG